MNCLYRFSEKWPNSWRYTKYIFILVIFFKISNFLAPQCLCAHFPLPIYFIVCALNIHIIRIKYSMYLLALSCLSNFGLLHFFVFREHELINLRHISVHWTTEEIYLFSFDKAFVKFEDCMLLYPFSWGVLFFDCQPFRMRFNIVSYLISIMSVNVKQITSSNTSSRANVMCLWADV